MAKLITLAIIGIVFWAFFAGSQWLILKLMGRPPKGEVYGSWTCFLAAIISAIAIVGLVILWIWFTSDFARNQILPWFTMVALFAIGGGWCLWSGWGVRARYNGEAVQFIDWRGKWHSRRWTDLTAKLSFGNTLMLAPVKGPKLYLDPGAPGSADLLIAAFEAGVLGTDKFVRRRSDRS